MFTKQRLNFEHYSTRKVPQVCIKIRQSLHIVFCLSRKENGGKGGRQTFHTSDFKAHWSFGRFTDFVTRFPPWCLSLFALSQLDLYRWAKDDGHAWTLGNCSSLLKGSYSALFYFDSRKKNKKTTQAQRTHRLNPSYVCKDFETLWSQRYCKIDNTVTSLHFSRGVVNVQSLLSKILISVHGTLCTLAS